MLTWTIAEWINQYGELALFALMVIGVVAVPIPVQVLMIFAGSLVHDGKLPLLPTLAATLGGAVVGAHGSYALGRLTGLVLPRVGRLTHLTPARLERVHHWFERFGKWTLIAGYFIPGVRHLTGLVAGATRLHFAGFALFACVGAAVWVGVFFSLGYFLDESLRRAEDSLGLTAWIAVGAALIVAAAAGGIYTCRRRGRPGVP